MKQVEALRQVLHEEVAYFEIGHLVTVLAGLTITREDLVVTIRRGVIGVGTVVDEEAKKR